MKIVMEMLDKNSAKPLYEQLYELMRDEILKGRLKEGKKLPSKRSLSDKLQISLITVENAYSQLIAEGYVRSEQRSGYYVQYSGGAVEIPKIESRKKNDVPSENSETPLSEGESTFPFSVWTRLNRSIILEKGTELLKNVQNGGAYELREAISGYLYRARGINIPAERIIIGSGTEYLYNLIIQLLGRDKCYGIENPGYPKLPKIYSLNNVKYEYISLDESGMKVDELQKNHVDIAHISPAHHFPTGIVMPINRRREILDWAKGGEHFIIEDDYDSEFRRSGKPVPTIFGTDESERVIYINTFSQTIAPSVRISYMCLPEKLYKLWNEKMGFYACTVPSFEQYTLARFISEGYFERHINRTKKRFRRICEMVLELISRYPDVRISEENAGLHFTVEIPENSDKMIKECEKCGIKITPLSDYYADSSQCAPNLFLVNYADACEDKTAELLSG